MVILIPCAVMGIDYFLKSLKQRALEKQARIIVIILLFLILEFIPLRGTDDLSAYYNTHAIILDSKGRESEAISFWEESSGMQGAYSSFANLSLGQKYLEKKDFPKAGQYLGRISDNSFAAAYKWDLRGDIHLMRGELSEAVTAYHQSLQINSGQLKVRAKLIKVLRKTDPEKAKIELHNLQTISSFYDLM